MTDKDLSDFIEHGENGFQEFAIAFGYAWASMAIQIAKELRTRQRESRIDKMINQQKKEWAGLTDEEYQAIRYGYDENGEPNVEYELFDEGEYGMEINIYVDDFARAIEAKLKEKNT